MPTYFSSSRTRLWLRSLYWSTPIPHLRHANEDIRIASSILAPGNVAIDVGADVGLFSLPMARAVGDSGLVVSIEPHPESFAILRQSLRRRRVSCVRMVPKALGQECGSAKLITPYSSMGRERSPYSRIQLETSSSGATVQRTVPIATLDDLAAEFRLQRLDLVKIDVEGYELEVLLGGAQSLRRYSPILVIELEDRHTQYYGRCVGKTLALLEKWGFQSWTPERNPKKSVNHWFRRG